MALHADVALVSVLVATGRLAVPHPCPRVVRGVPARATTVADPCHGSWNSRSGSGAAVA